MARLRDSWRTSLSVAQQPRNPQSESIARTSYEWSGPTEVKEHLVCRLEARHQTEREAHVLRLADLHKQRTLLVMAETLEHTDEVSGGSGADQGQSKLPRMLPPAWMISSPDYGRASP